MIDQFEARKFLRLGVFSSMVAGATALFLQAGRELRTFTVKATLDRYRVELADDVARYGAAVESLHEDVRAEAER